MRAFACTCGQPLFFDNLRCLGCGADVGYDPLGLRLGPLDARPGNVWGLRDDERRPAPLFRTCAHRGTEAACNWLIPAEEGSSTCRACVTTRTIPDLSRPRNAQRLRELESAKRRALFNLQALGLPIVPRTADRENGLAFDFLESLPGGARVMTGHASGVITINVAEADDDYRERNRDALSEPYRTVIGHMRHELGHYYWNVLVWGTPWLERFRALFGDEQADYGAALQQHYANGPPGDWQARFISSYAASHPWEDWAETWAHYHHMRSTLQTVSSYGLATRDVNLRMTPFEADVLYDPEPAEAAKAFLDWINAWVVLTTVLNETARSMGQPDTYPFVMNRAVVTKLHFVHCVVSGERIDETPAIPHTLQVPPVRD